MLRHASRSVQHMNAGMLWLLDYFAMVFVGTSSGNTVSVVLLLGIIFIDMLAKIGERRCPLYSVPLKSRVAAEVTGWPREASLLGRRWRFAAVGLRRKIVDFGRVNTSLVRSPLVFNHCGLAAETTKRCQPLLRRMFVLMLPLETPIMGAFIWSLAGMDASMSS